MEKSNVFSGNSDDRSSLESALRISSSLVQHNTTRHHRTQFYTTEHNTMTYLLLTVFISLFFVTNTATSQIVYNKFVPITMYANLSPIEDIPNFEYLTDANDNLLNQKINIFFEDYAITEDYDNKIVSRLRVTVKPNSLGEINLNISDVRLDNGSYCLVYTSDYKIVAGPIYQSSINGFINIVKIPAKELIIEVVADKVDDFSLFMNSLAFYSMQKKKNPANEHKLLSSSCFTCSSSDDGIVSSAQIINEEKNLNDCTMLGYGNDNELFELSNLYSAKD